MSPRPPLVQGGDSYAEGFGISILIPKNFRHESFEAEETAKELTIKAAKATAAEATAKAKAKAKDVTKKAEPKAKKSAAVQQAGAKQKIKEQAATEKQKAAAAPTKEDAKRCTVSFPGARVVLVSAALFFAASMALRGANSSISAAGAAEVVTTKSIFSWANDQQCGLYDNDDSCAVQEAFETTCSVPTFLVSPIHL